MNRILQGDCLEQLRTLPDASVHCCITSPPYWGLRDYGVDGQIGLEPTPDEYVAKIMGVFREVKRVLRGDGTLWLNLGDSYAAAPKNRTEEQAVANSTLCGSKQTQGGVLMQINKVVGSIKPKDLVGIPWRVAFALQADGWYLRQDIVWHKPNPMPESVRDRCTKSHEYVFLLTKNEQYYFDAEAISEPATTAGQPIKTADGWDTAPGSHGTIHRNGREKGAMNGAVQAETRNRRSVWTITTKPFKGAHFAVMPPKLVEPCLLAGCPEQCCSACGSPWVRVVERNRVATRPGSETKITGDTLTDGNRDPQRHVTTTRTIDWQPSCECNGSIAPGVVLDPFGGSGTVGVAAAQHGRDSILCELNPHYVVMAESRVNKAIAENGLFADLHRIEVQE